MSAIYLDASAAVKLIVSEPETEALRREVGLRSLRVSSALLAIEVARSVRRRLGVLPGDVDELLRATSLHPINRNVIGVAGAVLPARVASLDAIHLATALLLGDGVDLFVTYDRRLGDAARAAGLDVAAPV